MENRPSLTAYEIIEKKRDGGKLADREIKDFINGVMSGAIEDAQIAALLMAIYLNGMDKQETASLTDAMLYSGATLELSTPLAVDKHSTGGIGDKASFIIAPIAAAAGVKVPMIAGRGLGHTGGTIDKIEAIRGYRTNMPLKYFKRQVLKEGLALIGQTDEIAPADKKLYAIRDITATIPSIPLITASIMSKKLASGISGIVLDVKVGEGAFIKDIETARLLAANMMETAKRFNKKSICFITDMNQPLGKKVGHSLEIIESIETLKNQGPEDLTQLSLKLAGAMIFLAGKSKSFEEGHIRAINCLESGEALRCFTRLLELQHADVGVIEDYSLLPLAQERTIVKASSDGYIEWFDNTKIGTSCTSLGGGREKQSDKIDFAVGFDFHRKISDQVKIGDPILTIYHHPHQNELAQTIVQKYNQRYIKISKTKVKKPILIKEMVK